MSAGRAVFSQRSKRFRENAYIQSADVCPYRYMKGALKPLLMALGKNTLIALLYIGILYLTVGKCPIYAVSGLKCPGCGMTRAYAAVLRGDLTAATAFHPLWWLMPALWLLICLDDKLLSPSATAFRRNALILIAVIFSARWIAYILLL